MRWQNHLALRSVGCHYTRQKINLHGLKMRDSAQTASRKQEHYGRRTSPTSKLLSHTSLLIARSQCTGMYTKHHRVCILNSHRASKYLPRKLRHALRSRKQIPSVSLPHVLPITLLTPTTPPTCIPHFPAFTTRTRNSILCLPPALHVRANQLGKNMPPNPQP